MTNVPVSIWTDQMVEKVRTLWISGVSAARIAQTVGHGLTRNAVISKMHRMHTLGAIPERDYKRAARSSMLALRGRVVQFHETGGWTDARLARLKKLWISGCAIPDIAVEIGGGLSEVACSKRITRLRAAGELTSEDMHAREHARAARRAFARAQKPVADMARASTAAKSAMTIAVAPVLREPEPARINDHFVRPVDLERGQCKWPIGEVGDPDFHHCANPIHRDGKPYCEFHTHMAFTTGAGKERVDAVNAAALRTFARVGM